ncbi:MAG: class I SAM-dependent methyltransferase [Erysipelotrichaceae bacterium]|nr:class I SAM-dependent methyltransferase [Erysipelotrichaceae bacterium]MDY5252489.1 class I SAM-dependent methyltransferase [Erysipelotrichaceae bacterium]
MIYDRLAYYYDELVKDDEATLKWCDFVDRHSKKRKILELACGSGEISHELMQRGYEILATDISASMLARLNQKYPNINTKVLDMNEFKVSQQYDGIICFCDSINYLENYHQMFASVHEALKIGGTFLFDMHSKDRLEEFKEMFIEEGYINDTPYQWTIVSDENCIHQHFTFYQPEGMIQEQHVQYVFEPKEVMTYLEALGFKLKVYTDFDQEGIQPGEKIFIVGEKLR